MSRYVPNGAVNTDQLIFNAECQSEQPAQDLYSFAGKLQICGAQVPLDVSQLLLKGAVLKNTEWVLAFTVFTGRETRLMLNS